MDAHFRHRQRETYLVQTQQRAVLCARRIGILAPIVPEGGMPVQARQFAAGLQQEGIDSVLIPVHGAASWNDHYPVLRTLHHYRDRIRRLRHIAPGIDGLIVFSCSGNYLRLVTAPAVRVCNRLGIPVAISDRGGDTEQWLRHSPSTRWLFRSLIFGCKAMHVSSEYLKQVYAEYGIAAEAVPILIPAGRIPYRPRPAKPHLIINNRTMSQFHRVELSIRIFAELRNRYPELQMAITGDGCAANRCKRLARDLGVVDAISFPSFISQEETIELLGKADLVLNTSSHDNTPNAILEAFASGVPVVSSAVGGIPDLLGEDQRGYLVYGDSAPPYLSAITRAVDGPRDTLAKVERAHVFVGSLNWNALRADYLRVLIQPLLQS